VIGIELGVAEMEPVVEDRGDEVVRGGDGVEIAIEVEIDFFDRNDGSLAFPGGASLAAKDGSHRRFPQGKRGAFPEMAKSLRQCDGGGRLPFARRRRGDRADQDELSALRNGSDVIPD